MDRVTHKKERKGPNHDTGSSTERRKGVKQDSPRKKKGSLSSRDEVENCKERDSRASKPASVENGRAGEAGRGGRKKPRGTGEKGGADGGKGGERGGKGMRGDGGRGRERGQGAVRGGAGRGRRDEEQVTTVRALARQDIVGQRRGAHGGERGRGGRGGERGDEARGVGGGRPKRDNWGRSNSSARAQTPHSLIQSLETLKKLSGKDPSEVAITLSTDVALQRLLNERVMSWDTVQLVCLVLSKAFLAKDDRSTLRYLAGVVKDSEFLLTILPLHVSSVCSEVDSGGKRQQPQHLDHILFLLSKVFSVFPGSLVNTVSMLATLLQASISRLTALGVDVHPETKRRLEQLQGLVDLSQQKLAEGTLYLDRPAYAPLSTSSDKTGGEEEQDFRDISIYPTYEEFHQDQRPALQVNLTSQRYADTHHYLDTQFRLLREDFVRQLREGIHQLLHSQLGVGGNGNPSKKKQSDDITVFSDTRFVVPVYTHAGLAYTVRFDSRPLKSVRWESSKKLIYGSLVCLSCDNFDSFLFATVSNREPKTLRTGHVQLIFTEDSRCKLTQIQMDQSFLMVETPAYFEAYRYVLEGLQEQKEDELPFQRYIVECCTDVRPPAYLLKTDIYDLSSITDPKHQRRARLFHSLRSEAWPRKEELGLDESQMKALQLALTKELAIIQGPPGTGKTFVGLKIAKAMLTNHNLFKNTPVLVVCYTNHALDQFLEGIHRFLPEGIVRVGGRSNSEVLKPFNLREIFRSSKFKLPKHIRHAYSEVYKQMLQEEQHLHTLITKMQISQRGLLQATVLQRSISPQHWTSLHKPPTRDECGTMDEKAELMMRWLGLESTVFQQRATENVKPQTGDADVTMEEVAMEEDDLLYIAEEADLIQAERIIEDVYDQTDCGDRQKRSEDMEKATRELEGAMLAMNLEDCEIQAEQSEEGWEFQREYSKKMKDSIKRELNNSSTMTEEEERGVLDVWRLHLEDRWRLYRLWASRFRSEVCAEVQESELAYQNAADRLADVQRHKTLCVLSRAKVIGMTTTGAAKFRKVLQEVCPCLVIVEEAAQVLEAHIITTLSQACQHLILIGDHQQLRPSATVYDLARNYNLEVSMFERLVKMEFPYVRLSRQHRMRPDIARLLTPHIYPDLENHSSVLDYESIKGLKESLFFVEHNHLERESKDTKSHQNQHEAMFLVSLCRYLLFQDYKPEQITILTTYTSQLLCLGNLMPAKQFAGVKVLVVDKYQGEENDIVLLSLVRSNAQGKVGFLSIPNRVCVALSRAKKGLYIIGNSTLLGRVKLWSNIFQTLGENGQMGNALTLCCQTHPDRQVQVSCAEDFKQAPDGGCEKPCSYQLDCGHVCTRFCHAYDPEHKKYRCVKKCEKVLCDLGHRCPLECCQTCPGKCSVKVEKTIPVCQHTQLVPCHQDPNVFRCQEPCQKTLQCGHKCNLVCGVPCTSECQVAVTFTHKCGHSQEGTCYLKEQGMVPNCATPCRQLLKCGHKCRGKCHKCHQGRYHIPCSQKCKHLLICSHKCQGTCTPYCPPCGLPCENRCVHRECKNQCTQPCTPCCEPCARQCPHQKCSKLCHQICDCPPCTQPCAKTLVCGHPCIGLCGDKCPDKCLICHHEEVAELFFGTESNPGARYVQLEDCGHIFELTGLDKWMDDHQQAGGEEQMAVKLRECPRCHTPIRQTLRYSAQIKSSLAEIEKVKQTINGRQADIAKQREALKKQWMEREDFLKDLAVDCSYISNRLSSPHLEANDLLILKKQMVFLTSVEKLLETSEQMSTTQGYIFRRKCEEFLSWLVDFHQKFTDQQVSDLENELMRLSLLAILNTCLCRMEEAGGIMFDVDHEFQSIRQVLEKAGPFTKQDEPELTQALNRLTDKLPHAGLGSAGVSRR
ncbi:NFX1-type zinc finger-containing protein 1 [Lampris incognitus]|uniref:NFX1-type zinc finger-containing protein 1 n=1 Tax=Lampris incognitus TaxID=2546036 RepID=UPI0024B5F270|nr:NFX1-type zinc finger-containing protein 1 [Lampris incognitus]